MKILASLLVVGATAGGGVLGLFLAPAAAAPQERKITIHARRYAYEPEILRVNKGDTVRIRLISDDVTHGFYLEGYGINAHVAPLSSKVFLEGRDEPAEEIVFQATKTGKFRYRCSQTCGFLHPFMLGEMVVSPNKLYPAGSGMVLGLLLGLTLLSFRKGESS